MKVRKDILDYIYFGIFGIFIILFIFGQFGSFTGYTLVVIDNPDPNSMFPTYFQGDLFLLRNVNPEEIQIGDVIVYLSDDERTRVIHRVIDIIIENGNYFFRIKGDNPITNFSPDDFFSGTLIPFEVLLGKVIGRAPYLGHISLAMQKNAVVQIFVYFLAIIIFLAIVFYPSDDEDEETEESKYAEISFSAFFGLLSSIKNDVKGSYKHLKNKRHQYLVYLSFVFLIVIISFSLLFPLFVPLSYDNREIGVQDIKITREEVLTEANGNYDGVFYNMSVELFDLSPVWNRIKSFSVNVYGDPNDESTLISHTIWNTKRTMKGNFAIGGSIIIDKADANLYNGTALTIVVIVTLQTGFTSSTLEPYSETYEFISPFL